MPYFFGPRSSLVGGPTSTSLVVLGAGGPTSLILANLSSWDMGGPRRSGGSFVSSTVCTYRHAFLYMGGLTSLVVGWWTDLDLARRPGWLMLEEQPRRSTSSFNLVVLGRWYRRRYVLYVLSSCLISLFHRFIALIGVQDSLQMNKHTS